MKIGELIMAFEREKSVGENKTWHENGLTGRKKQDVGLGMSNISVITNKSMPQLKFDHP